MEDRHQYRASLRTKRRICFQAAQQAEKFSALGDAAVQAAGNHQDAGEHHKDRKKKRDLVNLRDAVSPKLPFDAQQAGMGMELPVCELILPLNIRNDIRYCAETGKLDDKAPGSVCRREQRKAVF